MLNKNDYMLLEVVNAEINIHSIITDLYNIEPIDIGEDSVESLTSYINRIAIKHNIKISDLFTHIILPKSIYYNNGKFHDLFSNHIIGINGLSPTAIEIANIMEKLTGRNDILKLNLFHWKDVIPSMALLKSNKSFCPACYTEQNIKGEVYDPLIWFLKPVEICSVHNTRLVDRCFYEDCRAPQHPLTPISIPGYCNKCKRWLGKESFTLNENEDTNYIDQQHWIISQVKEFIKEINHTDMTIDSRKYINGLRKIKVDFCENSCLKAQSVLNINYRTFEHWCNGESMPSFGNILTICQRLNINLIPLIKHGEIDICEIPKISLINAEINKEKKHIVKYDYNRLQKELCYYINMNDNLHLSIKELAKLLGVTYTILYKRFPVQCKLIRKARAEYLRSKSVEKVENLTQQVGAVVHSLHKNGEYPSLLKVGRIISSSAIFKFPRVYQAWKDSLEELGLRNK